MSYFGAQPGRRPAPDPTEPAAPDKPPATPRPLGAALGPRPVELAAERPDPAPPALCAPPQPACPLCRGALTLEEGLYRCVGRCGARWLEESPGRLIDIAALPFGICACCTPPQPLARGAPGAICPQSGAGYLLLPEGPRLQAEAAPDGLCACCAPPQPLIRRGETLVCRARPANTYQLRAGQPEPVAAAKPTTAATAAAIDAALRRNSARLTINGLFDLD